MKFAVKTATCLGCKTPLKSTNSIKGTVVKFVYMQIVFSFLIGGAVCNNCRPNLGDLYQKHVCIIRLDIILGIKNNFR